MLGGYSGTEKLCLVIVKVGVVGIVLRYVYDRLMRDEGCDGGDKNAASGRNSNKGGRPSAGSAFDTTAPGASGGLGGTHDSCDGGDPAVAKAPLVAASRRSETTTTIAATGISCTSMAGRSSPPKPAASGGVLASSARICSPTALIFGSSSSSSQRGGEKTLSIAAAGSTSASGGPIGSVPFTRKDHLIDMVYRQLSPYKSSDTPLEQSPARVPAHRGDGGSRAEAGKAKKNLFFNLLNVYQGLEK